MDDQRQSYLLDSHALKNSRKLEDDTLSLDEEGCDKQTCAWENSNSINISFRNLCYYVEEGFFQKRKKTLLDGVSGDFYSSKLTAIMGPSGAGKSTLMNILAGYTVKGVSGQVYINDHIRDDSSFANQSCYIMQDDNLQPLLTVYEALTVVANLKLPKYNGPEEKIRKVEEILDLLDLWTQKNVKTINLSGGQKKRLSIALELITNPQVMFFDEPTSGLDSVSSKQCVSILKRIASTGKTIICTIHQPSSSIFGIFDHLYVMVSGRCAYQGPVKQMLPYLEDVSLCCPTFHNPADFLMDVLNGDYGNYNQILTQKCSNILNRQFQLQPVPPDTKGNGQIKVDTMSLLQSVKSSILSKPKFNGSIYSTSCSYQVLVLLRRSLIVILRDKSLTYNRLMTHLTVAILIGFLYFGIGRDASNMLNNFKFMFFSVMFLMLTSFNCITTTLPSDLPVITREHFNKWYSLRSYYLALTFADIPVQIAATLIYGSVTYFLTMQPNEPFRVVFFLFMCVLISLVSQSFGVFIGACMDVKNGVIFGPFFLLPFIIFSGFFVQLRVCHSTMHWLFHISFLKYGFEGLVLSVLGYDRPTLPCNSAYCHFVHPEKFLSSMDMENSAYSVAVMFLLGLLITIRVSAYFILSHQIRKRKNAR